MPFYGVGTTTLKYAQTKATIMLANVNVREIATVSKMASDFLSGFCKLKDHNILEGQ